MKMKKLISCLLAAALCLALGGPGLAAAQTGTLTVRVETLADDTPIPGYKLRFARVADAGGICTAEFIGAGIGSAAMLDQTANAANARKLCAWAETMGLGGEVGCDDGGTAVIEGLDAGIYLVWAAPGNVLSFSPYLVYMPTVVNGEDNWDVLSLPKAEEDPSPTPTPGLSPEPTPTPGTEPTPTPPPDPDSPVNPSTTPTPGGPVQPDTPSLPQTGINRLPVHLLLGLGILSIAAGLVLIIRKDEEEVAEDE